MNYEYAVAKNTADSIIYGPVDKATADAALKSYQEVATARTHLFLVVRSVSDWREIH